MLLSKIKYGKEYDRYSSELKSAIARSGCKEEIDPSHIDLLLSGDLWDIMPMTKSWGLLLASFLAKDPLKTNIDEKIRMLRLQERGFPVEKPKKSIRFVDDDTGRMFSTEKKKGFTRAASFRLKKKGITYLFWDTLTPIPGVVNLYNEEELNLVEKMNYHCDSFSSQNTRFVILLDSAPDKKRTKKLLEESKRHNNIIITTSGEFAG